MSGSRMQRGLGRTRAPIPLSRSEQTGLATIPGEYPGTTQQRAAVTGSHLPDEPGPPEVRVLNKFLGVRSPFSFFEGLPPDYITQVSRGGDKVYDYSLVAGQTLQIYASTVGDGQVLVLTDVIYYATAPGSGMGGQPIELEPAALAGLLRFRLLFNGAPPAQQSIQMSSPYLSPGQVTGGPVDGWAWLERPFGAQRAGGYALFAQSATTITVEAIVDDVPRFPLSKVGVRLDGFLLTQMLFDRLLRNEAG